MYVLWGHYVCNVIASRYGNPSYPVREDKTTQKEHSIRMLFSVNPNKYFCLYLNLRIRIFVSVLF